MWKKLPITDQTYFMHCYVTSNLSIACILYGIKGCWCEIISVDNLQERFKLLNRRIGYSEYVRDTLLESDVEEAVLEEQPHGSNRGMEMFILKLKYRIEGCPLRYEWSLTKQSSEQFHYNFINPLLITLESYMKQVEILKETLQKKDEELKQYRREGFTLQRKTLQTKPFNFDEFEKNHTASMNRQKFNDLAKIIIKVKASEDSCEENVAVNVTSKSDETMKEESIVETSTKISPKKRKRKMVEMKLEKRQQILNKNKTIQYESQTSQSTATEGHSEEEILKYESDNVGEILEKGNVDDTLSARRSTRSLYKEAKNEVNLKTKKTLKNDKLSATKNLTNYSLRSEGGENRDNLDKLNIFESNEEDELLSNDGLHNSATEKCDVASSEPALEGISHQLQVIQKDLKELDDLRLADLNSKNH